MDDLGPAAAPFFAAAIDDVDVAIVGSGPAGLGAALALKAAGIERLVVLERDHIAGGVPRHCGHPPYGLWEFGRIMTGPTYAKALVARAEATGIVIRTGVTVTFLGAVGELSLASASGSFKLRAKRVILATGVRESPRAARLISGDRPMTGVMNTGALQAFVHLEGLVPCRRPVIVGSELVALSALFTCRKAGIKPVAMLEANAEPTARRSFALLPRLMGVPLRLATRLCEIVGSERVEAVIVERADGETERIACDAVIFSGGFVPAAELVRASQLALDTGTGGPSVDQFGRCSDGAYYATGNLLRPVENAGWSHREGRLVGGWVADDLQGRLDLAAASLPVTTSAPVRYAMPQRLVPGVAGGLERLQIRLSAPCNGELRLLSGDIVLSRSHINAKPEQRLSVPLPTKMNAVDPLRLTFTGRVR